MDLQYADDISWVAVNCSEAIQYQKDTTPTRLWERNLKVNSTKTEEFVINHANREGNWRKCKYFGSMLDSSCDVSNRKRLAMVAYQKLRPLLNYRTFDVKLKVKIFTALITSIYLYNCEIWTLTNTLKASIDSYQSKMLRWMLNIRWPNKVSNEETYRRTGLMKWSRQIESRRMRWLGHVACLPPANQALNDVLNTETKKPRGGQRLTGPKQIIKDLERQDLNIEKALGIANDRAGWRRVVHKVGGN